MSHPRQRRLEFEGAVNFRDVGGYAAGSGRRTRWHTLYRADSLADLTPADEARLRGLGLRTLIDFRLPEERRLKPNRLAADMLLTTVELGFVPAGTLEMLDLVRQGVIEPAELERRVTAQYRLIPIDHCDEYRQMFAVAMAAERLPLLIHCTSGKDRTGFGIAVLLLAIGVPRDVVLEDYQLTNRYRRPVPQLLGPATSSSIVQTLTSARGKYLEAALDEIDRVYGSVDEYLATGLKVSAEGRAHLVEHLTEPDEGD